MNDNKVRIMKKKSPGPNNMTMHMHLLLFILQFFHPARFSKMAQVAPSWGRFLPPARRPDLHSTQQHLCWSFQPSLIASQWLPSLLMPLLLNQGSRDKSQNPPESSLSKVKAPQAAVGGLTRRLRDANERDGGRFYDSKAFVFTGATFNDGDFGVSVKGFTASRHKNLVFSWIVF